MLIKICGMREPENIAAIATLAPDMMGFIFYEASPRYAGELSGKALTALPEHIRKVGVFVNAGMDYIREKAENYHLDMIQLHGDESPEFCDQLKINNLQVIKAFGVDQDSDFQRTIPYESVCDLFLFDTRSKSYGGTGCSFDWNILEDYTGTLPFLLSGGISGKDASRIRKFSHPKLLGIDLNSRFEVVPGVKNIDLLTHFLTELF